MRPIGEGRQRESHLKAKSPFQLCGDSIASGEAHRARPEPGAGHFAERTFAQRRTVDGCREFWISRNKDAEDPPARLGDAGKADRRTGSLSARLRLRRARVERGPALEPSCKSIFDAT